MFPCEAIEMIFGFLPAWTSIASIPANDHAPAPLIYIQGPLPLSLFAYQPQVAIGTLPPNWDFHLNEYQDIGIRLRLEIFYHDSFGMAAVNSLTTRKGRLAY
jgi:hypothetical protein